MDTKIGIIIVVVLVVAVIAFWWYEQHHYHHVSQSTTTPTGGSTSGASQYKKTGHGSATGSHSGSTGSTTHTHTTTTHGSQDASLPDTGHKCQHHCAQGNYCHKSYDKNKTGNYCYQICNAKANCKDGSKVPRYHHYFCDYSYCSAGNDCKKDADCFNGYCDNGKCYQDCYDHDGCPGEKVARKNTYFCDYGKCNK